MPRLDARIQELLTEPTHEPQVPHESVPAGTATPSTVVAPEGVSPEDFPEAVLATAAGPEFGLPAVLGAAAPQVTEPAGAQLPGTGPDGFASSGSAPAAIPPGAGFASAQPAPTSPDDEPPRAPFPNGRTESPARQPEATDHKKGNGHPPASSADASSHPAQRPPSELEPTAGGPEGDAADVPLSNEDLERLWVRLRNAIRARLKREQFETWFTRTVLVAIRSDQVTLAVHNNFTRDWLKNYYRDVIDAAVDETFGQRLRVAFLVDPERTANLAPPEAPRRTDHPENAPAPQRPGPSRGMAPAAGSPGLLVSSDVVLNPSYRFSSYVVGPCNRFAHAACVGVSETPGHLYNPLFLHGNVGLGKTHLMQSLCHTLLERDQNTRILFLSCETFVNHFIAALEDGDLQAFRNKYRNVDLLVVDDIHILANKEKTQEEFFHTFNTLYNAGKQIVLSSDSPPIDIPTLQDRLVSRFKWGLVTEIETPCYETRMAILKRKSRDRGRELPEDVASFLAERIESNIRELEGAVTKVLGYASLSGRTIDLALVRECLGELFQVQRGEPSIEDIMGVVTKEFGVKLADLQSRRRTAAIAFPRQIGMFLARRITRMSLEEIGGYFGGRDHSTVLYGVQKIDKLSKNDPKTQDLLSRLLLELQDGRASF